MEKTEYMRQALTLAARGAGRVAPNPMVGCVIVKDDRVIGEGWHEQFGGLHAERNALKNCTEDPAGATLYVTLEPCCHYGKTPPCTEAIIEHKIAKVVVGCLDANPLVAGKGVAVLRDHAITVTAGVLEEECRRLNEAFFYYIQNHKPFVVMKYAMTLDGKIAAAGGDAHWVTGEAARAQVHETRNRLSAIMVGVGTVLADDPLLTCRMEGGRNPIRIVCDSHLRLPLDAQLVQTAGDVRTIVATLGNPEKEQALAGKNIEILHCNEKDGRVDLQNLMQRLGEKQIDSLLLEGGAELNFSALSTGIVQKVQAYIAPKLIGGATAKTPVGGAGFPKMDQAVPLQNITVTAYGEDLLLEGYPKCLQES